MIPNFSPAVGRISFEEGQRENGDDISAAMVRLRK
jgi:hypothetical protein